MAAGSFCSGLFVFLISRGNVEFSWCAADVLSIIQIPRCLCLSGNVPARLQRQRNPINSPSVQSGAADTDQRLMVELGQERSGKTSGKVPLRRRKLRNDNNSVCSFHLLSSFHTSAFYSSQTKLNFLQNFFLFRLDKRKLVLRLTDMNISFCFLLIIIIMYFRTHAGAQCMCL